MILPSVILALSVAVGSSSNVIPSADRESSDSSSGTVVDCLYLNLDVNWLRNKVLPAVAPMGAIGLTEDGHHLVVGTTKTTAGRTEVNFADYLRNVCGALKNVDKDFRIRHEEGCEIRYHSSENVVLAYCQECFSLPIKNCRSAPQHWLNERNAEQLIEGSSRELHTYFANDAASAEKHATSLRAVYFIHEIVEAVFAYTTRKKYDAGEGFDRCHQEAITQVNKLTDLKQTTFIWNFTGGSPAFLVAPVVGTDFGWGLFFQIENGNLVVPKRPLVFVRAATAH